MNTNARYIITTASVAAGLFAIGATANALSSDNTATPDPLGAGVVLPSASADSSASTSLVEVEYAEQSEPSIEPDDVVLPDAGWSTGAGSAGDDDDDDSDDDSDDESDDDSDDSVDD
jgi:phosphopantothenoylcysteine synthetase/decarboxylase